MANTKNNSNFQIIIKVIYNFETVYVSEKDFYPQSQKWYRAFLDGGSQQIV